MRPLLPHVCFVSTFGDDEAKVLCAAFGAAPHRGTQRALTASAQLTGFLNKPTIHAAASPVPPRVASVPHEIALEPDVMREEARARAGSSPSAAARRAPALGSADVHEEPPSPGALARQDASKRHSRPPVVRSARGATAGDTAEAAVRVPASAEAPRGRTPRGVAAIAATTAAPAARRVRSSHTRTEAADPMSAEEGSPPPSAVVTPPPVEPQSADSGRRDGDESSGLRRRARKTPTSVGATRMVTRQRSKASS
jgi:hypothetical protein